MPDGLSLDEWRAVGHAVLRRLEDAARWWLGVWLNYGEDRDYISRGKYDLAQELTQYKRGPLWNLSWVSRHVKSSLRSEDLSWHHHKVVASLDAAGQKAWLAKAAEKKWSVAALRRALKESKPSDYPPWLCYTDVWNIPDCDERFGIDYPGRIPGQIIQNLLYYYTEPGALVVDPMAGGGVTLDVCKAMDRRCIAFDLEPHPERRDILGADALEPWLVTEPVDLVFMDPPYWSQQENAYGGVARAATHEDFLVDILAVMHRGREHLKPGGVFAVLLAPMAIKTEYQDSPIELVAGATRMGWKLIRRFSVPVSSQQVGPQVVADCKAKKIPVALLRDLLLFRAA